MYDDDEGMGNIINNWVAPFLLGAIIAISFVAAIIPYI